MQKLDFIVGGCQKCGTTALSWYLRRHPRLASPARKELHFFDEERIDWSRPDYTAYHRCFGASGPGMRYEVTPAYLWWPQALERIRAYRPDIKLIFLFRDPTERAFSNWCMTTAKKVETMLFAEAIRAGRARIPSGTWHEKRRWSYVERGFYGAQVAHLLTLFPRRQLLFLRAEDLANDPQATLDRLLDFVGQPRFHAVPQKRVHERREMSYPSKLEDADRDLLANLYRDDLALFSDLTGLDVSNWPTLTRAVQTA